MNSNKPLIFLPEHQRNTAAELNTAIAAGMQKVIDDQNLRPQLTAQQRLHELYQVIDEAIRKWLAKYPMFITLSIGFDLQYDVEKGKVTMIPSHDLQKLMAGIL